MYFSLLQDAFGTAPNAALRPSHTPKGCPGRRHEHYFLLHARAALAERDAANSLSEHALVSTRDDEQHVLYSEASGGELGTQSFEFSDHVLACGFSFTRIMDGWHHVAAVAEDQRTRFFVDAEFVGEIAFALHDDIAFVKSDDCNATLQYAPAMADYRAFAAALQAAAANAL